MTGHLEEITLSSHADPTLPSTHKYFVLSVGFVRFPAGGQSMTWCRVAVSYPNKSTTGSTDATSTDPVLPGLVNEP